MLKLEFLHIMHSEEFPDLHKWAQVIGNWHSLALKFLSSTFVYPFPLRFYNYLHWTLYKEDALITFYCLSAFTSIPSLQCRNLMPTSCVS